MKKKRISKKSNYQTFYDKFSEKSIFHQELCDEHLIDDTAGDIVNYTTDDEEFKMLLLFAHTFNVIKGNPCVAASLIGDTKFISLNYEITEEIKNKLENNLNLIKNMNNPFDIMSYLMKNNCTVSEEIKYLIKSKDVKKNDFEKIINALKINDETKHNDEINSLGNKIYFENFKKECFKLFEYFDTKKELKFEFLQNPQKLHAEMAILEKIIEVDKKYKSKQTYNIAATKYACEFCHISLQYFKVDYKIFYEGSHRRVFSGKNWNIPSFFKDYEIILKTLYECVCNELDKLYKRKKDGTQDLNAKYIIKNRMNANRSLSKKLMAYKVVRNESDYLDFQRYPKLGNDFFLKC